ncbi:MAG TPA: baseplate J/gp47 family protein [Pyrinomonadaceae bacterium]
MSIINREALEERARKLFTVPTEISDDLFGALSLACRTGTLPPFYSQTAPGDPHVLIPKPHELSDVQRNDILECLGVLNGIKSVEVRLVAGVAELDLRFFNRNSLNTIFTAISGDPALAKSVFPLTGGHRLPAGQAEGQVQTVAVNAGAVEASLVLTIAPVGDYSTYTLAVDTSAVAALPNPTFDPLFDRIEFKFRPGCFNTNCAPEWKKPAPPKPAPAIDYLAKDYDSFRHAMIAAMMERVPGWEPSSEADLDQVLLELFSAAADELSDYQDRVMNEAYLATARKRVSLARHARLVDYHIHQGNQASTWVALELIVVPPPAPADELFVREGFRFWAGGEEESDASAVVFMTRARQPVHPLANRLGLYTWSNAVPSLAAGSTTADIEILVGTEEAPAPLPDSAREAAAKQLRDMIRAGTISRLLVEERLNPATGGRAGRDPQRRQLLRLVGGDAGAEAMFDPATGTSATARWFVRVRWREVDALRRNYCFTVECPARVEHVSFFHGNLVEAHHGRPADNVFKESSALLAAPNEFHYERLLGPASPADDEPWLDAPETPAPEQPWSVICRLPAGPLAYRNTPPGGDIAPQSTLAVTVVTASDSDAWDEVPNLIHSDASDENGDHFVVETDELGRSLVRFGNGINGKLLPADAVVRCAYQVGEGLEGNIGSDRLVNFDRAASAIIKRSLGVETQLLPAQGVLLKTWNPFDVTNGRAPEPAAEIIRRAPEAYRLRQLRAVTLRDYVERAEAVEGVSRAAASYAWTGSWRTVRVTIDAAGTGVLTDALRRTVARQLEAVRLIGEDLEIRPPRFVPLDIRVALCVAPDYWPEDLRFLLEQEFSDGYTPDGRRAFFHPDLWTFGQPLRASQIIGRAQSVQGVEHVISVRIKRWNETGTGTDRIVSLRHNEIIRVANGPDHLERGFIFFDLKGGRQ